MKNFDKLIEKAQSYEITEHEIYEQIARKATSPNNKKVLTKLSEASLKHYKYWEGITKIKMRPNKFKVLRYTILFRVFGPIFGIKLLEQSEKKAEKMMEEIIKYEKKHAWILEEEKNHEQELVSLLDEKFLRYLGEVVLGANDAMVSTVGTAAGLSVALHSAHLIGMTSLISGATAALSMSASEYLSSLSEKTIKNPIKAGFLTGFTYLLIVILLVTPYFLLDSHYYAFAVTITLAALIIVIFSFYVSVTQEMSFKKRLSQNILLTFGISLISFIIGYLVNRFFGLDV